LFLAPGRFTSLHRTRSGGVLLLGGTSSTPGMLEFYYQNQAEFYILLLFSLFFMCFDGPLMRDADSLPTLLSRRILISNPPVFCYPGCNDLRPEGEVFFFFVPSLLLMDSLLYPFTGSSLSFSRQAHAYWRPLRMTTLPPSPALLLLFPFRFFSTCPLSTSAFPALQVELRPSPSFYSRAAPDGQNFRRFCSISFSSSSCSLPNLSSPIAFLCLLLRF